MLDTIFKIAHPDCKFDLNYYIYILNIIIITTFMNRLIE